MSANQNITFLDKKSQRCVNKTRPQNAKHTLNANFAENTSNASAKLIFSPVLKSPTQIGFDGIITANQNMTFEYFNTKFHCDR
jgi:hypothetical protein